jgi:hypothetical protein
MTDTPPVDPDAPVNPPVDPNAPDLDTIPDQGDMPHVTPGVIL